MGRRRAEWVAAQGEAHHEGRLPADEAEERHYITDRNHASDHGRRAADTAPPSGCVRPHM
jgi:hypothetical protein